METQKKITILLTILVILTVGYVMYSLIFRVEEPIQATAGDGNAGTISASYAGDAENLQGLE